MANSETVECGACLRFSRSEAGTGLCAVRGEGARRWPFLIYPNWPLICGDFAAKPARDETARGQGCLELEAR